MLTDYAKLLNLATLGDIIADNFARLDALDQFTIVEYFTKHTNITTIYNQY